jgi:hypothetical protein
VPRKAIGDRPLTVAERSVRFRQRRKDLLAAVKEAHEEVCWQRNHGDGHVSLDAIDQLTDAFDDYLAQAAGRNDEAAQPQRGKIACEHCGGTGITD